MLSVKPKKPMQKKRPLRHYIKAYPPKEEDKVMINYHKGNIASAYHKEKNYDEFNTWVKDLPMADKAGIYNNLSGTWP